MSHVKGRRHYDSSRRRETARQTRARILEVAEVRFLDDGYAPTTIVSIAKDAGVSAELIYKVFGGKGGLVKAIYELRLAGAEPVPAYGRSDEMREHETDPRAIMRQWGLLTAEVAATLTPIRLLLRAAAATDPDMAALLQEVEHERMKRMRHHAEFLAERGYLGSGVTLADATDILWACSSAELYDLMVLQRHWPLPRFARFITDFMTTGLLRG